MPSNSELVSHPPQLSGRLEGGTHVCGSRSLGKLIPAARSRFSPGHQLHKRQPLYPPKWIMVTCRGKVLAGQALLRFFSRWLVCWINCVGINLWNIQGLSNDWWPFVGSCCRRFVLSLRARAKGAPNSCPKDPVPDMWSSTKSALKVQSLRFPVGAREPRFAER